MADAGAAAEIEAAGPAEQPAAAGKSTGKATAADKSKKKREKPDDAVKLGCGGLFRRKKKAAKAGAENGAGAEGDGHPAASKAPVEKPTLPPPPPPPLAAAGKPEKGSPVKGTVKMEQSPQCQMWSNIVTHSMVGTGIFKRAAACSLATGGVFACAPAEFTPSVEQVAALRDNFANRQVFSAAGFGVADTVYSLQEESATPEILAGVDRDQTEGVLVALCNTVAIVGTFTEKLDVARETLSELRSNFVEQGL